jgi:hypothetical protein
MNKIEQMGVFAVVALVAIAYITKKGAQAAGAIGDAAKTVGTAINPTNPGNVFYEGTNAVGAIVTSSNDFNLGSWVYDVFHADPFAPGLNGNNTGAPVAAGTPNGLLNSGGVSGSW